MGVTEEQLRADFMGGTPESVPPSIEQTIAIIADRLSYRESILELMQLSRVNGEDIRRLSLLYSINNFPVLKSRLIDDYMVATLSLKIAKDGGSRKELLEIGKGAMAHAPIGMIGRLKGRLGFNSD